MGAAVRCTSTLQGTGDAAGVLEVSEAVKRFLTRGTRRRKAVEVQQEQQQKEQEEEEPLII